MKKETKEHGQRIYLHLLELSKRIASADEYLDLSIKVLGLPDHQVESIWNKHRPDTNQAAYDALKTWFKKQPNAYKAFSSLHTSLQSCEMSQLAIRLEEWTESTNQTLHLSNESEFFFIED